jgi:tRNA (Thr-GGU) A37 N-methylase
MQMQPIGRVSSPRKDPIDDDWLGLLDFSHVEVVYVFDKRSPGTIQSGARHPRNNPDWPRVGIFAQRGSARPNLIGVTVCQPGRTS